MKLKKIVKTSELSEEAVVFNLLDATRVWDLSRDINFEDCNELGSKWVPLVRNSNGRLEIDASAIEEGTCIGTINTAMMCCPSKIISKRYFCTDCGEEFDSPRHTCDTRPRCTSCHNVLKTSREAKACLCTECAKKRASTLYSYHGRPNRSEPQFERPHIRTKYPHLGAEIEVDHNGDGFTQAQRNAMAEAANADIFNPIGYMETDCTIAGHEFITRPTTLKGYNNIAENLTRYYDLTREYGGRYALKNGLHFHIDRQYFEAETEEAKLKVTALMAFMVYHYYEFWRSISGREQRSPNGYYGKKGGECFLSTVLAIQYHSHGDALNLSNENTIELRIFGGHIDTASKFLAVADIVNALAKWTKEATLASIEKATPVHLVRYINDKKRVLEFVESRYDGQYDSPEGRATRNEFINALRNYAGDGNQ